jgi:hypothetical protein
MQTRPCSRALMLGLLGWLALAALASSVRAEHTWGNYHWARTSNPFTLQLGDNVSSAWDASLAMASSDWSQSSVLHTATVAGSNPRPKNCKPVSGRVEVCNASYGNTGWLGIAQIWVNGDHITQGVTKLNDYYFNTAMYNTPAWRQLVMCQEVGHTFGLDHQDEDFTNTNLGTCMDYTNDPATNQHPNAHDYEELESIYAHLDTSTTVGQTSSPHPAAMQDISLDGPAQWGKVVKQSHDGGTEVYALDFGHGHRVFTFVTWTLEVRRQRGHHE